MRKHITESGLNNSAAKLVPANSIAVVTRVGVGKLSVVPFEFSTSQDFLSLSNMNVDIWYGVYSLYSKLQRELNSVQGTSIKGITKDELLNKEIAMPLASYEQTSIGAFFSTLDSLITENNRKLENLKQLKKAYLQQMFPQAGETSPRLRFADFTDEWIEKKLKQILKVNSGKDYKHLNNGDIPVYGTGGYMISVDESLSDVDAIGIGRKGTINKPQCLKAPF